MPKWLPRSICNSRLTVRHDTVDTVDNVDTVDMRGGEEIKENYRLSGQGKLPPYKESQKRTHQENR